MKYTKIKTKEQYNEYCTIHEKLTFTSYETNSDEIELIEILIDEFENRTISFSNKINPVQTLTYLLEVNNLSKSQLAKNLGVSRQLVTDILNYRRNISKTMANKLSEYFKMQLSAFIRPYTLSKTKTQRLKQPAS